MSQHQIMRVAMTIRYPPFDQDFVWQSRGLGDVFASGCGYSCDVPRALVGTTQFVHERLSPSPVDGSITQ